MDSVEFTGDPDQCRPLSGRVLIEIERKPERVGSIVVPETATSHKVEDTALFAKVLKVGYGPFTETVDGKVKRRPGATPDDIKPGDRVVFRPLMMEMNCKMVITALARMDAVFGD